MLRITLSLLVLAGTVVVCFSESAHSQEVLTQFLNDKQIKADLNRYGRKMLKDEDSLDGETLKRLLAECDLTAQVDLINERSSMDAAAARKKCFQATVVIGMHYDCGKCSRVHLATSGGVLINEDGLILTNHHVVEHEAPVTMVAMTMDGEVFPVVDILAANEANDTALIKIQGDRPFPFVKISESTPFPADETLLVSHPQSHFYTSSIGTVSRYSARTSSDGQKQKWMEITNEFCRGSSGCGVFNSSGELVGLVSRKSTMGSPTADKDGSQEKMQPMTVFRCVPLQSIMELLDLR